VRPATRFLSRFDKSATNIKESQIFISIGQVLCPASHIIFIDLVMAISFFQVPWALSYSKWYHQYQRFPSEALQGAALLSEYTLTDVGSWVCLPKSISSRLKAYKCGSDDDNDPLLNPAHVLRGGNASVDNEMIHKEFMSWVVSPTGGQRAVENFSHLMFSKAPG
jgi:ABC-type tungstate transport system permease subunit